MNQARDHGSRSTSSLVQRLVSATDSHEPSEQLATRSRPTTRRLRPPLSRFVLPISRAFQVNYNHRAADHRRGTRHPAFSRGVHDTGNPQKVQRVELPRATCVQSSSRSIYRRRRHSCISLTRNVHWSKTHCLYAPNATATRREILSTLVVKIGRWPK